ncbi:complement C1q-like protein 3 [Astyanax mexicanus]|uniref:Complement C1q-like protein 3 n=1 Tax=Astyanax mexicanus TaxID=7994 RepID=A0A8T2KN99_ASTMX|nr:complement C1q-like protein 3 [Astyanax mexicanus]
MELIKVLLLLSGLCSLSTAQTQDPLIPTINVLKEILALKSEILQLKDEVKTLREGHPKIAFTAALDTAGINAHIGPFSTDTTLVFKHVETNIGEGFNPETGVFTAPVNGVYFFAFNCFAGARKAMSSALYKNEQHIVSVWDQPTTGDNEDNSFNAATLLLEPGDRVYIRLLKNSHISKLDKHSTFSGFLIYPLKSETSTPTLQHPPPAN